ncbi:hypothetical protein GCM10010518_12960 [Kitasatospora cinereorecta]
MKITAGAMKPHWASCLRRLALRGLTGFVTAPAAGACGPAGGAAAEAVVDDMVRYLSSRS